MTEDPSTQTIEAAFERLEVILEQLSTESVSLDDSLKLYEEANGLLLHCHERLAQAEQKVVLLVKDREGKLAMNAQGTPVSQPFPPMNQDHGTTQ